MHRQFLGLVIGLALLRLVAVTAQAQDTSAACDRACLQQMLDKYLVAVFKHDPAAAQLTDDHYATEDTVVIHNGEGFWKNVSGYGAAQGRYFDPVNETAAFLGLLKQDGQDTITSVRIRVVDHKISEAEWITGQLGMGGLGDADPQGLLKSPPPNELLPPSQRSSRFLMIALANNYFQANKDHDASWLPNDPDCVRVENGVGPRAAVQSTAAPAQGAAAMGPGCLSGFSGMDKFTTDIALRRFTVVDEEAGMILGTGIYVRYAGTGRRDNLVSEYFLIRDGKIHGIWSAMHFLPLGAPDTTGWEQRHGIWR
jgi:hypothetical protein